MNIFKAFCLLCIFSKALYATWDLPATDLSSPGQSASTVQVAVGNSTAAAAVWARSDGSVIRIEASVWNGSTLTSPEILSAAGQHAGQPQVGMDSSGNAIAIWRRSNGTNQIAQASYWNGSSWSSPEDLSATGFNANNVQIAMNSSGEAIQVLNTYFKSIPFDPILAQALWQPIYIQKTIRLLL